jgi:hypothetical protein
VSQGLLGSSVRSIVGLGRKTHRKREHSEAGRQSQGPRAKRGLACRTEAAADGEADNHRQSTRRSVARLGHIGRIAPEQHLASGAAFRQETIAAVMAATKGGPTPRTGWAKAWQIVATQAIAIRPRPQSRFFDNR